MAEIKDLTPEQRIAALESLISEQNKTIKSIPDQSKKVAALESTVSQLNTTIKSLSGQSEKVAALESTLAQQKKTISALSDQLAKTGNQEKEKAPEALKIPEDTFTVDDHSFKFVVPVFVYKTQKITAIDALADKEILAHLVAIGSGVITEVF